MTQQLEFSGPRVFHVAQSSASFEQARDEAMRAIVKFAGRRFLERARWFVIDYLREHGRSSGEDITDACIAAGISPVDQRHFGPVFSSLSRAGKIVKDGSCPRRKGHGTSGGVIWKLA